MKIHFSPDLDYQREAMAAIVEIFQGQGACQSTRLGFMETALGVGNRLWLPEEEILQNVRAIQLRNGLAPSERLDGLNFTVEMETGTGKTYVYLRTIFELHRQCGFTKFIIVVPSIAVKEGVYKSLQMMAEHFRGLYDNVPFDYFVYDSERLGLVRNFAASDYIQIMIINIDAFRKGFDDPEKEEKANIIHRPHDRMTGARPIEFIRATHPIVIIDEPQSVDTTPKSKQAIASLNPLCTLRYSATHLDRYNMLYRLDSVDAYERKLVKQIEVASVQVQESHNQAYIKLLKVENKRSPITATIEMDVRQQKDGTVKRVRKIVRCGDDLRKLSGGRDLYDGYIIGEIYCERGNEYISFTSKPEIIRLNQAIGEIGDDDYKRLQIRRTIEKHLDKETELRPKGIKVLSLFFIDRVANYRWYDADGNPHKGKYALIFEEEYARAIRKPKYRNLFEGADLEPAPESVHDGYFAIDKKKDARGNAIFKDSRGDATTQADESAYALIMRDKERLLSFESKLRFIFSHSALKEGWDNPNVFQICTLNETHSVMKKRQEIGRGLRIAVNQDGERVYGHEVNTLTVIANESYEEFARKLQQELEEETGIEFGVVEKHLFAHISVPTADHRRAYLGVERSQRLWEYLRAKGYLDPHGRVQDSLRRDLKAGRLDLPAEVAEHGDQIAAALRKVAGRLKIKNADERLPLEVNQAVALGEEFQQLWDRIRHRATFRVDFDCEQLIARCAEEIKRTLVAGPARFITQTARLGIDRGGVAAQDLHISAAIDEHAEYPLPDLITFLQSESHLTRRSLVEILRRSERLPDFKQNPQRFIEQVAAIIKRKMRLLIADGIKYEPVGDHGDYVQELFAEKELLEVLKPIEFSALARALAGSDVKVYGKLPGWFKIDTPLGSYNPDWAVLVKLAGREQLYFVVESKGSILADALRKWSRIPCQW